MEYLHYLLICEKTCVQLREISSEFEAVGNAGSFYRNPAKAGQRIRNDRDGSNTGNVALAMGKTNCLIGQISLVNESYRRDLCEFFALVAVKHSELKANPTQKKHLRNIV